MPSRASIPPLGHTMRTKSARAALARPKWKRESLHGRGVHDSRSPVLKSPVGRGGLIGNSECQLSLSWCPPPGAALQRQAHQIERHDQVLAAEQPQEQQPRRPRAGSGSRWSHKRLRSPVHWGGLVQRLNLCFQSSPRIGFRWYRRDGQDLDHVCWEQQFLPSPLQSQGSASSKIQTCGQLISLRTPRHETMHRLTAEFARFPEFTIRR